MKNQELIIEERITKSIYLIRDQKVMLDSDLAELYGVKTRTLKQAVRRNRNRFPEDFMFELLPEEWNPLKDALRSQNVILDDNKRGKHSKYVPFVFTEHGVAMLSSVPENCCPGSEPVWGREYEGGGDRVTNRSLTISIFII